MLPALLDATLAAQPWFAQLRPDERLRIGARLTIATLSQGNSIELTAADPRIALVAEGSARLSGGRAEHLFPGDAVGVVELCTRHGLNARLDSPAATVLLLDRPTFDQILVEFPSVAGPFVAEVARELRWKNDLLREVTLTHAEGLPDAVLERMLRRRKMRLERRRRGVVGRATRSLMRRLVADPARQPAFWTLLGFILALTAARTVVGEIIRTGAQKHFFALIGGASGHPIHIHHFNYGIVTVTLTGLAALHPRARQVLRLLAFTFGFGTGLVIDEFALLWNLNPDYYQGLSRAAILVSAALLVQLVYLRNVYAELGRRFIHWLGQRREES